MTLDLQMQTVGGVSYLARPGPGPAVVFLHGIGSNATSFASLLSATPAQFNLLAWNAPGYLGSDPLPDAWPLAKDYARRLADFLDDMGLASVHLVGHSLGTLIAAAFARQAPERVESLLLASCANGYGVPQGGALSDKTATRLKDLARLGPKAFAHARAANLVHDPTRHPALVARVEAAMAQIDPQGYTQAVRMLASGDLPRDLAQVAIRPAFVIGAEDQITPIAQTTAAAQAWAKAHGAQPQITEIPHAGHAVYLQHQDAFCAALTDHLAGAVSTPEGV